jgi:AraC-like DNA-binding protein
LTADHKFAANPFRLASSTPLVAVQYLQPLPISRLTIPANPFGISAMSGTKTDSYPAHGAIFALAIVEELEASNFSPEQIVGNTGINLQALDSDEPKLSFDKLALLFERAAELIGDDLLGFRQGKNRNLRLVGMVAYIGVSAATVRDCLHSVSRYMRIFSDALELDVSRLDEDGVLEWRYAVPASVERRQYVEFAIAGLVSDLRELTRLQLCPENLEFQHSRARHIREIEKYFGCSVSFGCGRNRVVFKQTTLEVPLQTADNHLHRVLTKLGAQVLVGNANKSSLLVSLEREIGDRLASGTASQEQIARAMGMSARSLSRKLAKEGTSFLKVVESYRKAMAESLISETGLQLTQIAFLLGYSDLSSFSSAFKRWTGRTPSAVRRQA